VSKSKGKKKKSRREEERGLSKGIRVFHAAQNNNENQSQHDIKGPQTKKKRKPRKEKKRRLGGKWEAPKAVMFEFTRTQGRKETQPRIRNLAKRLREKKREGDQNKENKEKPGNCQEIRNRSMMEGGTKPAIEGQNRREGRKLRRNFRSRIVKKMGGNTLKSG